MKNTAKKLNNSDSKKAILFVDVQTKEIHLSNKDFLFQGILFLYFDQFEGMLIQVFYLFNLIILSLFFQRDDEKANDQSSNFFTYRSY